MDVINVIAKIIRKGRFLWEKLRPVVPMAKGECFAAYLQLIRDDFCLYEVCHRLAEEGVQDFFWAEPDRYWSGEPLEMQYAGELDLVEQRLKAEGLKIRRKTFHIADYGYGKVARTDLETHLRNDSLCWIRQNGFRHIIIVDGDELWYKGVLSFIRKEAANGVPALALRMTPVIGFPGLPVEGASDLAIAYIGPGRWFNDCRTPLIFKTLQIKGIIHFTGIRRSLEETISKHRRSCHYDDPEYDFEGWIQNTLPNVKVGLMNAHMYRQSEVWPEVRSWKECELEDIPVSLHRYLRMD